MRDSKEILAEFSDEVKPGGVVHYALLFRIVVEILLDIREATINISRPLVKRKSYD